MRIFYRFFFYLVLFFCAVPALAGGGKPFGTAPVLGLTSFDGTTAGQLFFNNQPNGTKQANVLSSGLDFTVTGRTSADNVTLSLTSGAGFGTATSTNNRFVRAIRGSLTGALQSLSISSDDGSTFALSSIAVQCSTIPAGNIASILMTPYRSGVAVGSAVVINTPGNSTWGLAVFASSPGFQDMDEVVISATTTAGALVSAIGVDAIAIAGKPTVTTTAASSVLTTTAALNGTVNDDYSSTTTSFLWGTSPTLTGAASLGATPSTINAGSGSTAISAGLSSLTPNTTYYYQAVGTNASGTASGAILSFTTSKLITVSPISLATATDGASYGPVTFSASGGTAPYTFAVTSGALPPGLTLTSGGQLSGTPTAAGPYAFTVVATDANSVASDLDNLTLLVDPPTFVFTPQTLPAASYGVAYFQTFAVTGGTAPYSNFTVSSGALPPGIVFSSAGVLTGTPTAAGTYNFSVSATDASGGTGPFTESSGGFTVTVDAAHLTVTVTNETMVYGSTPPLLLSDISYSGFVNGDNASSFPVTLTSTATSASPVGVYPLTAQITAPNYNITYVNGTLTVTPALLSITPDDKNMTYGGAVPALTASYTGFVNGDNAASLTTPPTLNTTATSSSPVNTYPITASGAVDPNYTISYTAGTLTIGQAALSITADDKSMMLGGSVPTLTASYSGFVNGDNAASLTAQPMLSTTATSASSAGNYPIAVSGAVDPNYLISYVNGTLSISKAILTITANDAQSVYGAALVSPGSLSVSYSGFVNGDGPGSLTVPPIVTNTALTGAPAGTYTLIPSGAVDPNYTIQYVNGLYTVTQANLTIAANNQSMNYGGPVPALTLGYSGFVNGDNSSSLTTAPTIATTATAASGFGTYPITASGAVDPNYNITYAPGTLTVNPALLYITATNQSMTYGSALPALTVSYLGFANGDNAASLTTAPSVTTTASAASVVGIYPITASGAADPNYSFVYYAGTLTVTPAALTVTAADESRYFAQPNPPLTVSYTGFVNGDNASSLTTPATATTAATVASPAGPYPITPSGAVDPNYAFNYVDGTLTIIAQLPNLITFGSLTVKKFGDPDFIISASATDGLPVTFTSGNNAVATVTKNGSGDWVVHIVSAGQVVISANQAGDVQYAPATAVDVTLVIDKADQAIVFPDPLAGGVGVTGGLVSLNASASSGLPVTYTVSGPASLSGNQLTLTGIGEVIITASQAGNIDYNPAIPVTDTLQIYNHEGFISGIGVFPNPVHGTLHIRMSQDYQITKVVIFDMRGRIVLGMDRFENAGSDIPLNVYGLIPGIYFMRVVCIRNNELVSPVFKIEVQ